MVDPTIDAFLTTGRADELLSTCKYKQAGVLYLRNIKSGRLSSSGLAVQYNRLGAGLYREREYQKALAMFKKAAELDPFIEIPYNAIGSCYSSIGEFDLAIEFFQKSIFHHQETALAYVHWALALLLQEREEDALKIFEKVKTRYFNTADKQGVLRVNEDEIKFARERIAKSTNQYDINVATMRIIGVQYMIDLINKTFP